MLHTVLILRNPILKFERCQITFKAIEDCQVDYCVTETEDTLAELLEDFVSECAQGRV